MMELLVLCWAVHRERKRRRTWRRFLAGEVIFVGRPR